MTHKSSPMQQEIRHRRLYAFFNSKALNMLMIMVVALLMLAVCVGSLAVPVICATIALVGFAGYSAWLWLRKPKQIAVSRRLSKISSAMVFYYLIVVNVPALNLWWYIVPVASAAVVLAVALLWPDNETFVISEQE